MRIGLLALVTLTGCSLAVPTPTPPRPPTAALAAPAATVASVAASTWPQPTIGEAVVDSPEWAVLGFLRGWQARDFGAMAVAAGAVGDAKAPAAATFANRYDFRPMRGAEIVAVERRGPSLAMVTARVWYEFPPGRVERKRLELVLERTDAPRTASSGVSPWRVNAASAASERDDP